ncbi:glycosyltransferase family 22 protein [Saccharata proteae CBS 121410]|uniref:Mannosyltransferase n=1 Tax=Saccharata proteae CBS 121410 TaxID=1314787 RepID=A0A9P4LVH2_9PEZI|nr:glycosyltransferase family 22 protein [Saccharata proteae CBS 121410]
MPEKALDDSDHGHVFLFLLALRLLNALTIRTFFQPDEYYQALEPAWRIAFGHDSGAWITWEWRYQLRSSMHPALFAAVLSIVSAISDRCTLPFALRSELLIAAPKITQALFAALTDYCSWKLAERLYGRGSSRAWTALALTACSPWQWFCSTRTLSNCLETALTSAALSSWPWHWLLPASPAGKQRLRESGVAQDDLCLRLPSGIRLRLALLLAAFACVLRPTNTLIWICVSVSALLRATPLERHALVREAVLCGFSVLALSATSDRLYYGEWAFPPLRFVHFNIAKSLAVFYGTNRADYYLTEGLPLLLTTALPWALVAIRRVLWPRITRIARKRPVDNNTGSDAQLRQHVLPLFATTTVVFIFSLSLISHKEVRFIYPLLPILHVLAAEPLGPHIFPLPGTLARKTVLAAALALNISIAAYATLVHQRGVIDVLHVLRHHHEQQLALAEPLPPATSSPTAVSTVAFLMPCHSTPWRSHLVHPGIDAWALTCEPPIHVPLSHRSAYRDQADQFYDDPVGWLGRHLGDLPGSEQGLADCWRGFNTHFHDDWRRTGDVHLVFFAQLEPTLKGMGLLDGPTGYRQCWRGFNTHFHDDWRRSGDVVVWCREV